jgi:hypothetical protein
MAKTMTTSGYLIVRASGDMRVTKTRPPLRIDEVAFPLTVSIPATWGRVQPTSIDVALPDPPEARVTVDNPEMDAPT